MKITPRFLFWPLLGSLIADDRDFRGGNFEAMIKAIGANRKFFRYGTDYSSKPNRKY